MSKGYIRPNFTMDLLHPAHNRSHSSCYFSNIVKLVMLFAVKFAIITMAVRLITISSIINNHKWVVISNYINTIVHQASISPFTIITTYLQHSRLLYTFL